MASKRTWHTSPIGEHTQFRVTWFMNREQMAELLAASMMPVLHARRLRELPPDSIESRIRSELYTYGPTRARTYRAARDQYYIHVMRWARKQVAKL